MNDFPVLPDEDISNYGSLLAKFFGLFWAWFSRLVLLMTLASLATFALVGLAVNIGKLKINSIQELLGVCMIMLAAVGVFVLNVFRTCDILKNAPSRNAYVASMIQAVVMGGTGAFILVSWAADVIVNRISVLPPTWGSSEVVLAWLVSLPMMLCLLVGCLVLVVSSLGYGFYATKRIRPRRFVFYL